MHLEWAIYAHVPNMDNLSTCADNERPGYMYLNSAMQVHVPEVGDLAYM